MKQKTATAEQAQDAIYDLAVTGSSAITFDEAFELLEGADEKGFVELTSEYFNFDTKGTYNFLCEGISEATIDGKTIEIVKLRNKEGKQLINGNAVLVNSCKRLTVLPAYIRVNYVGEIKNAKGTYKDLQILTLPQAVK
jgi:hypothetical protein